MYMNLVDLSFGRSHQFKDSVMKVMSWFELIRKLVSRKQRPENLLTSIATLLKYQSYSFWHIRVMLLGPQTYVVNGVGPQINFCHKLTGSH